MEGNQFSVQFASTSVTATFVSMSLQARRTQS